MKSISIFILSAYCLLGTTQAAVDLFIKFTGSNIATQGETQVDGRKQDKWGEILSFSAGIENTINISDPRGGAGKASFKTFEINKWVDTASVPLMTASVTGNRYSEVTIEVVRSGGGDPTSGGVILRIQLKDVYVQSLDMSTSDGDDNVEEQIVLVYGAHKITTYKQDLTGKLTQAGVHEWSVILNQPKYDS